MGRTFQPSFKDISAKAGKGNAAKKPENSERIGNQGLEADLFAFKSTHSLLLTLNTDVCDPRRHWRWELNPGHISSLENSLQLPGESTEPQQASVLVPG